MLFSVTPLHADDTVNINNLPVTPGESAAQCYHDATEHLRNGEWFERAIAQLKEAVRQDPKNSDYHLALGCAYADRVASLGWALAWNNLLARDKKQYPQDLADWQKDQTDPKADDYGKPPPIAPPTEILVKDDGKPLKLTRAQTAQKMQELCGNALGEWKEAIRLSGTSAAKAKCEYVQGWGMLVLEGYAAPDAMAGDAVAQPIVLKGFPTHKDIVDALEAATSDDPTKAIYWQSLGDVLGRPSDDPAGNDSDPNSGHSGMPAYRKALSIDPKNAVLLYYLSQYEGNAHPDQAVADLKQSIKADSANAFPIYLLASYLLRRTGYEKNHINDSTVRQNPFTDQEQYDRTMAASLTDTDKETASHVFALLDQAQGAPFCFHPIYHPAVPDMLSAVYDYEFRLWFDDSAGLGPLRNLARDLTGYADFAALQSDLDESMSVDQKVVAVGQKLIGNWPINVEFANGSFLMELTGMSIVSSAYNDMIRNAQHYGDPDSADAIQAERDSFMAVRKAYLAAVDAAGEINMYAFY